MAEVALEHLFKVYANGVEAVRDFCLQVADGQLVVLVGPSGCGKTTTLRLIAGLEEPTAGTIHIGGRIVNQLPPRERDVALVAQRSVLYPHLTVRQNLLFGQRMRHRSRPVVRWAYRRLLPGLYARLQKKDQFLDDRVAETACLMGVEDVLDRRPSQLSGGQQQRVALGRALVRHPAVFLLDEPLSHLDGRLRAELRHELHLLQRRLRATMIYVTHDQAEAMTLADRVVVMDQGVIQQVDRPLAIYERPCNRFVAGFLGWPSMNFVDGQLVSIQGELCFATPTWSLPVPTAKAAAWKSYTGQAVTLGIRPEDIGVATQTADAVLAMEVVLVEALGHAWLVTFQRDGWRASARLADHAGLEDRQKVEVLFRMNDAHLFDRSTGLALGAGRPAG